MVLIFAVAGAWLSATYVPALLDWVFAKVEEANFVVPEEDIDLEVGASDRPGTAVRGGDGGGASGEDGSGDQPDRIQAATEGPQPSGTGYPGSKNPAVMAAMALLGAIVGGAAGNLLSVWWVRWSVAWEGMEIGDRVSFFIGVFAGIVASLPFLFVFQGLPGVLAPLLTFALVLGFTTVSIYALKSMEEILPWQKQTMSYRRTGRKILDTNVIIDGRILDIARTGFLEGEVYVPKFVIEELQHVADSPDALRRQRGRRGLEILKLLQAEFELKVGTYDHRIEPGGEVDARLVKLAKALGGDLVSNDFNLNKVASLQDVTVLNINDLALSLRPNVLPGEKLEITIIREGSQPGQGIGYLVDGTMVVVEDGFSLIGEVVQVAVTQVIQTERGKMIFADDPKLNAHDCDDDPAEKKDDDSAEREVE